MARDTLGGRSLLQLGGSTVAAAATAAAPALEPPPQFEEKVAARAIEPELKRQQARAAAAAPLEEAPPVEQPVFRKDTHKRESFYVPRDISNRVKNIVDALSGPPHRLNISLAATEAFTAWVEQMEHKHNEGKQFPQRGADSLGGRPMKLQ